ncbi:MAG: hypothetical protein IKE48_03780 [Parasporobacterium sp.]|nr:hypothetical protein [Parasporobacterium sp.]
MKRTGKKTVQEEITNQETVQSVDKLFRSPEQVEDRYDRNHYEEQGDAASVFSLKKPGEINSAPPQDPVFFTVYDPDKPVEEPKTKKKSSRKEPVRKEPAVLLDDFEVRQRREERAEKRKQKRILTICIAAVAVVVIALVIIFVIL